MTARFIKILLIASLALTAALPAFAGVSQTGGTGLFFVDTPEVVPPSRLLMSIPARFNRVETGMSELDTYRTGVGFTLGFDPGIQATVQLPFHGINYSNSDLDISNDFSFQTRDLQLKLQKAWFMGRARLGVEGLATAPTGANKTFPVYSPDDSVKVFTSDEWNAGVMGLVTLPLLGANVHLNGGYYWNGNEDIYYYRTQFDYALPLPSPEKDTDNNLVLAGAAVEFPIGRWKGFVEASTEQLVNRTDLVKQKENPVTLAAGMNFLFPGDVGLTAGAALNMSSDDPETEFNPEEIYPDWQVFAALSFGEVFPKRQRTSEPMSPEQIQETAEAMEPGVSATAAATAAAASGEEKPKAATPNAGGTSLTAPTLQRVGGPGDPDGDGIFGESDLCPTQAEDKDGFRDSDGCPDLDNDGDGILDTDDLCPNSPEDFVGPYPNDGCPTPQPRAAGPNDVMVTEVIKDVSDNEPQPSEPSSAVTPQAVEKAPAQAQVRSAGPEAGATGAAAVAAVASMDPLKDTDADGIPDSIDRCPLQAEDLDGWQDTDGCPDLDNDEANIPDNQGDCPNASEIFNRYQDDDGCPDTLPQGKDAQTASEIDELRKMQMELSVQIEALKQSSVAPSANPFADYDNDGVSDNFDKCPEIPEDVDGWEDTDGCPDIDNDGDTVPDMQDNCPNVAGPKENKGCPVTEAATPAPTPVAPKSEVKPEPKPEVVPEAKPMATRKDVGTVNFGTATTDLSAEARAMIDALVPALQASTAPIELSGFSDSSGPEEANYALSKLRADRVRAYLVQRGVAADRIYTVAHGEDGPIASNATAAGRAQNRRVVITLMGSK